MTKAQSTVTNHNHLAGQISVRMISYIGRVFLWQRASLLA